MGKDTKKITKRHNHHHFWIEDGVLYETYTTIRGLRYCMVMSVPFMIIDMHEVSDDDIKMIEANS